MTVKFKTVERGNPQDPSAPKKHYPLVQNKDRVTVQELAKRAAEISTLSPTDVAAAIEAFLAIVPDELADGNIVSLGDFGSFRLRTHGEGAATAQGELPRGAGVDGRRQPRPALRVRGRVTRHATSRAHVAGTRDPTLRDWGAATDGLIVRH